MVKPTKPENSKTVLFFCDGVVATQCGNVHEPCGWYGFNCKEERIYNFLVCPQCEANLDYKVFSEDKNESEIEQKIRLNELYLNDSFPENMS